MQISLRSQMIAGTAAVVGASAIALTPVAPAVNIPALSAARADVALAAVANPLVALLQTGSLLLNYALKPGTPVAADWQYSGIGPVTNGFLKLGAIPVGGGLYRYGPEISNVGLIPNIIANPFPVLSQLAANLLGYTGLAIGAAAGVLAAGADIVWSPVGLTIGIVADILTGNIANIPVRIQDTIAQIVGDVTAAVNGVVNTATVIGTSIIGNATNLVSAVIGSVGSLIPILTAQVGAVAASVQGVITDIAADLAVLDVEQAWNDAVNGLLGPSGVPGTIINLTLGAGLQAGPTDNPATLIPSDRVVLQSLQNEVAGILRGETPAPPAAASPAAARSAASVKAAPAAVTPSVSAVQNAASDNDGPSGPVASLTADNGSQAGDGDGASAPTKPAKAGASRGR